MSDTERPAETSSTSPSSSGGPMCGMEPRKGLALQALATIQALDAEPLVKSFREEWTGGEPLPELSPGRPVEGQGLSRGERSPEPGTCRAWQAVSVDPATGGGVRARGEAPRAAAVHGGSGSRGARRFGQPCREHLQRTRSYFGAARRRRRRKSPRRMTG